MAAMYGALDRGSSPLAPALRSLVQVRVSQVNWCPFCVDINSATCLERGVGEAKLQALPNFRDSSLFDDRERTALAYADAMSYGDQTCDAAMISTLQRFFSDDAIIELTALVAYQNMSSKFNAALNVPAQGFCGMPT